MGRDGLAAPEPPAEASSQSGKRPNVIIAVLDDMRASDYEGLPRTSRMVRRQGTIFPNFVVNTPVCGPSRATLFTGQLPHNHQVLENSGENGAWNEMMQSPASRDTVLVAAQRSGYRTGLYGKYLNGAPRQGPIADGLDAWSSTSERDYRNFQLNIDGEQRFYTGNAYSTDDLADQAVEFIRKTPGDQPFLLVFSPTAPKQPAIPHPRFRNAFKKARVDRTPAWNEDDTSDKPARIRRRKPLTRKDVKFCDDLERQRLQTLLSVDLAIARFFALLRQRGQDENTILMVMTDNGYALGHHRLVGKGFPYDGIVRAPLLAFGPGIPRGVTDERLACMADVAPTISALTGMTLGRVDGLSLLGTASRTWAMLEKPGVFSAIRSLDELYVEYETGELEYYDYRTDPWELNNRLADWEGLSPTLDPAVTAALARRLAAFRRCAGPVCREIGR